eukprot:CAMPEP_0181516934 /NCGR_PEP_ID=MMETSP1110-20121109/64440_1 /TAXON_ID=174948 /ORGANISM="Symbiodinium sp., Strain CCMP421" /LENGTH=57 /DNA_ID=CAMNT_0023647187 /DNA_START=9 /DNA_END=179 /DNA_ORIENTATION=-
MKNIQHPDVSLSKKFKPANRSLLHQPARLAQLRRPRHSVAGIRVENSRTNFVGLSLA